MTITLSETEKALFQKHMERQAGFEQRYNAEREFIGDLIRALSARGGIPVDAEVGLDTNKGVLVETPPQPTPPPPA
jgi:hypothetical protein